MKRKVLAWVLTMSMAMTLLPTSVFAEGKEEVTEVFIGATELVSGKYYRAANRGDAVPEGVIEIEESEKGENYLYYDDGVLTVEGIVYIDTNTDHALTIDGGTLTITGGEDCLLSLDSETGSAIYNSTGTEPCLVQTKDYYGDITLESSGLKVVSNTGLDLSTTGNIVLYAMGKDTEIVNSTVEGDDVYLSADRVYAGLRSTTSNMFTNSGTLSLIQAREGWSFPLEGNTSGVLFNGQKEVYLQTNNEMEITNTSGKIMSSNGSLTAKTMNGTLSIAGENVDGGIIDGAVNLSAPRMINIINNSGTKTIHPEKKNTYTTEGYVIFKSIKGLSVLKAGTDAMDMGVFGGEIADKETIDFRTDAPTEKTHYIVGNGYLVYTPAKEHEAAEIVFHEMNAYTNTVILPDEKVVIGLEGYNTIPKTWENVTDLTIQAKDALAELEITETGTLDIPSMRSFVVQEGVNITNKGCVYVPFGTANEDIAALGFAGTTGIVGVKNAENTAVDAYYDHAGVNLGRVVIDKVSLADTEVTAEENLGYTWLKSGDEENPLWTLTLDGVVFKSDLYIKYTIYDIRIVTKNDSRIIGEVWTFGSVDIAGEGTLEVNRITGGDLIVNGTLKAATDENACAVSFHTVKIAETGTLDISGGCGISLGGLSPQGFSYEKGGNLRIDASRRAFVIPFDYSDTNLEETWNVPADCMPEGYGFTRMEVEEEEEGFIPLYYYEYVLTQEDKEGNLTIANTFVLGHIHTPVIDAAVEPTYTQEGKTEGSHCSGCGEILKAQEIIPVKVKPETPTVTTPSNNSNSNIISNSNNLNSSNNLNALNAPTAPKGTSILKLTATKKGFVVKWKKQKKQTTGYEIQYSTNKKFTGKNTKIVSIKKNEKTKTTLKKLKAKKKYFVRIRTYKTIKTENGKEKLYSGWSKAKKVVTKR